MGYNAGTGVTTGYNNTLIGHEAGNGVSTGHGNTFIGHGAGQNSTSTGSNNTFLGNGAFAGQGGSLANNVVLGNSSVSTLRCQQTSITGLSDQRDKTDIVDLTDGLSLVNLLKPRKFTWAMREPSDNDGTTEIGFIAQELDTAFGAKNDYVHIVDKFNPDRLEAAPAKLIPILVKAIQELSTKVTALEAA